MLISIKTKKDDFAPNECVFDGGELSIYGTQYNIAREIISRMKKDNFNFDLKNNYNNINFMILGPTYVELKKQTINDLSIFLKHCLGKNIYGSLFYGNNSIDILLEKNIVNSNNIDSKCSWMEKVRTSNTIKDNCLHVLIIDELHWGSSEDTKLTNFLKSLHDEIKGNPDFPILILGVSATIDVLSKILDDDYKAENHKDNPNRVDWKALETQEKFRSNTYVGIDKMDFINDAQITENKSQNIIDSYLDCLNLHFNPSHTIEELNDITSNIIKQLLPNGINKNCSKIYTEKPIMVVVRLTDNEDVKRLHDGIIDIFNNNGITSATYPFEVISQIDSSGPIDKFLSERGKNTFNYLNIKTKNLAVANLKWFPCIVIVNKKLSMGERLPSTCLFFDIRARYLSKPTKDPVAGETIEKIQSNYATFTQDVGRVAGHNKPTCTIYLCTNVISISDKILFRNLHSNLTTRNKATKKNTEHEKNSKIFSNLKKNMIILDAEPQIGKTGVLISMLSILIEEHIVFNETQGDKSVKKDPTHLKYFSDKISEVSNLNIKREERFEKLKEIFSDDQDFKTYHKDTSLFAKDVHKDVYGRIFDKINDLISDGKKKITILDCGCGMFGVFSYIRNKNFEVDIADVRINVYGSDVNSSILSLEAFNKDHVIFTPIVNDFCHTEVDKKSADFIVFSLSLFQKNITDIINWAKEYINEKGTIFIVDLKTKFPNDFIKKMNSHGLLSKISEVNIEDFHRYGFQINPKCNILENNQIELNH